MKKLNVMTLHPADHGEIRVELDHVNSIVKMTQGGDTVWVPAAEFKEFCQHLIEWADKND